MKRAIRILLALTLACLFAAGCMMTGTHEEILKKTRDDDTQLLEQTRAQLTKERDDQSTARKTCEDKLTLEVDVKGKMGAELAAKGMQIDKLLNEKGVLSKERSKLSEEQTRLAKQIEDLEKMKAATEKRMADYRTLIEKLRSMIDAGTLQVKVRNGLMLVQLSSDVVFPSASVSIKAEAKAAIEELAQTIQTFTGRRFQVIGHSDPTPIRTERFPSNWELSSQRAVEVVRLMVKAGVPPEMLSAAGSAEFDPLTDNESPDGRSTNRRVEIVFLPKIDEMPGFDQVLSGK